jgi:preprotein translocase subunit SecB
MSNGNTAVIQFIGYRITKIVYDCDPTFDLPQGEVAYKFNFNKMLVIISEREVQENVCVNVFYSETDDMEGAPFRLSVEIAGRFRCDNEWQPEFEANILAIIFPYLRSIVSTITCNSGREPIILPTINIASLFE